ncbi:hypothetical protein HCU40_14180 [Pseudanabaena biceps]|nr:hypothetical protein [Pseudanabaena biceps]
MEPAYIIAIAVVVALIVLFVMFRFGIGFFKGGFRAKHGDSEFEGNAEIRGAREGRQAGTVVKGTKMIGKKQKMRVAKDDTRVEDTVMKGEEQEFIVDESDREDNA